MVDFLPMEGPGYPEPNSVLWYLGPTIGNRWLNIEQTQELLDIGLFGMNRHGTNAESDALQNIADAAWEDELFFGLAGASVPTAALQIYSNNNDGEQLDASIYIDRLISRATGHSAHGITDETVYDDTGVGQYAVFDAKVTMRGNQNHLVGGQFRPRFEGAGATISEYVAGWNTSFISDEPTHHIEQAVHFSAGSDATYDGTIGFQAAFIAGNLSKGTENWAFYTTQNTSRFRGVMSFFGTLAEPAWNFFGDEDTGFYRSASNTFSIFTGGERSLDITPTFLSSVTSGVEYFRIDAVGDSFIRDDRLAGVTRFSTINAASGGATAAVASIGARNATAVTGEVGLIVSGPEYNQTGDWLLRNGAALRTNTGITQGLSVAVLAGDYRLYTSGNNIAASVSPAYGANAVTAASWSGGQITFTTTLPHSMSVGTVFTTSGFTPSGYNGTWTALSGTRYSTIIVERTADPGASTVQGTINARIRQANFLVPLYIGDRPEPGADATILLRRNLNNAGGTGTGHGITINDDFSRDTFSYAAFDDQSSHSGVNDFGHHRGFQARSVMNFTGTMTFWDGFSSEINGSNASTVIQNLHHFVVLDDSQYAGSISGQQYGLYVNTMTKGTGGIYALWVNGNQSRFPGNFIIDALGRVQMVVGASGAGNLSHYFNGDTDTGFYRSAADTIAFQTGGTNRAFISSDGITIVPPALIAALGANGHMAFEFTSNTEAKIVARGSDGTTRKSAAITLS